MTGRSSTAASRACSGTACATRGPQVILRQKDLGIWRAVTWDELGRIGARGRHGPRRAGLRARRSGLDPVQHQPRVAVRRPRHPRRGRRRRTASIRPTRRRRPSTCSPIRARCYLFVEDEEQLDKVLEVRERLPKLRKIIVFDMEGLRDFDDAAGDVPRGAARAGRRLRREARGRMGAAHRHCASPRTWRSWSTPRAPPASPRAR